jgi:uncharacterized membrane protein YeaQ/YmgE (transglycosylase-associated protein family)
MADPNLQTLLTDLDALTRLDKLPDLALVLIGVGMGVIAKNIYALVKNMLGFAGSFAGKLAVGWWQDLRRETPNILDVGMAIVGHVEGRDILIVDGLVGPRKLTDVYLNPRTAFAVRIQAFFLKTGKPFVQFAVGRPGPLGRRFRAWRNRRRAENGLPPITEERILAIKYRRVYAPLENLVNQYLTNEWAAVMAVGEPCYVFRFVVALVYEKYAEDYIDRQFHALVVWDEALRRFDPGIDTVQPEYVNRPRTIAAIAERWRVAPREFGQVYVMVPRSELVGDYIVDQVPNAYGATVPVHRPVGGLASLKDRAVIQRRAARVLDPE